MSTADEPDRFDLIVGPDGTISAEQIGRLGLRPGAHLRVVADQDRPFARLSGSMPGLPDLGWEDFERGSALARADLGAL